MRGFGLRFRLFGFPVIIDPSFLLLVVILYLTNMQQPMYALMVAACILVSVMVHEFGHAVVGRVFGLKSSIRMTLIGGLTEWTDDNKKTPTNLQFILITLAGPFAGFVLGGLVLAYCVVMEVPYEFTISPSSIVDILLLFNFFWGLANLLPLYPLDGGQVLYYTLRTNKNLPADQISAYVSLVLGGAIIVWAAYSGRVFLAFILIWLLSINFQRLRAIAPVREEETDFARGIMARLKAREYKEGLDLAAQLMRSTRDDLARNWASVMSVVLMDLHNDPATTLAFMKENGRYLNSMDALRFLKLKAEGDTKEAMAFAGRAAQARPSLTLLVVYASEMVRQGQFAEAQQLVMDRQETALFSQLGGFTQMQLLTYGGWREAVAIGEAVFRVERSADVAFRMGAAYARLDNPGQALRWLEEAVRAGYLDSEAMATDSDLASLADHHGFVELLEKVRDLEARQKDEQAREEAAEDVADGEEDSVRVEAEK
jgi:Zn-dependent protease